VSDVQADDRAEPEARAPHEPPLSCADLPATGGALGPAPEDFVVDEVLLHQPSGEGEHLFVRIRKRELTTQDALEAIARTAGVHPREVGSAGMKDKHAVTTQWLSLPSSTRPVDGWQLPEGLFVLESTKSVKKLRTGQLTGNHFRLRLTNVPAGGLGRALAIAERLRSAGLPNYFGAQRFGAGGGNLARALFWLSRAPVPRGKRGRFYFKLYPSVVQSEVFNRYLTLRRELGFERLLDGEVVRLDGSGSVFVVDDPERERARLEARDIHPTGPMPGPKMKRAEREAAVLEERTRREAGLAPELEAALGKLVDGTRRDLLVWTKDLAVSEPEPGTLELSFFLPAGSYATGLVRELTRGPFFGERSLLPG
jgi:tRNA pseudouridine13 synthase